MKDELKQILSDTLGVPKEQINEESSVENIEEWDSLAHLNIILSIEQIFNIAISPEEAADMTDLASIRRILRHRGVDV